MNTRNELIIEISTKEKQFEKNKLKRAGLSFFAFFVINFILLGWLEGTFENPTAYNIGETAILAIIYTVIIFFASLIIFGQLFNIARGEEDYLKALNKKLSEME